MKIGAVCLAPAVLLLATLPAPGADAAAETRRITVYAAASLTDVLDEAAETWRERTSTEVRCVHAASSALARQIAAGAPADLVIMANADWMNWLEARGLTEPGTRRDVARNRLVVIVPEKSPVTDEQGPLLGRSWRPGRLAIGETSAVPAGIYARQALQNLGRWDAVRDSLVFAGSVRVALAWVSRGEVDAGIVYASDAAPTALVRTVWRVPRDAHAPIRYPAAALKGRRQALAFLDFLAGEEGRQLFAAHGFLPAAAN